MKNSPINFFKYWKKHGLKKTWKQWKYNMIMLYTPEEALKQQSFFYGGMIVSGIAITIVRFVVGDFWMGLFFCFVILLLQSQMRTTIKQRNILVKINKQRGELLEDEE